MFDQLQTQPTLVPTLYVATIIIFRLVYQFLHLYSIWICYDSNPDS